MGKARRRIPAAPIAFGIAFTLIVVIAIVLSSSMNRQRVEPEERGPGATTAPGTAHRKAADAAADAVREEERSDDERAEEAAEGADRVLEEGQTVEKTGYTIAGQVVDEKGEGVAEAEVLFCFDTRSREPTRNPVARRLKTDADGHFQARDLPKKRLLITATSKDLCYYMPGLQLPLQAPCWYPVTYLPGRDSVTGVRLVLRPGAVIAGTVVDTEGEPVTNAIVTLRYVRDAEFETATDAAGRFRAENLQPGIYLVRAKAEGFAELHLSRWVKAGTEDLVVRLPRTCTVEGTVLVADTREPVAGAEVTARVVQPQASHAELGGSVRGETAETDPDGVFKVSVLPGMDAVLSASWKEYYSKEKATVHVEAEWPTEPVTIELVRGAIVSGTVVDDETDAPVPGVRVRGYSSSSRRNVQTESGEEGRFTLAGLAAGKNRIFTENDFSKPSLGDSYRVGESVLVEVVVGEHQSGIELRIAKKPAIAGKVVDEEGEPIFGALVVIKGETDESRWPAGPVSRGFSEGDGTFVMRHRFRGSTIMGLRVSHPLYANTDLSFEPDGVTSGTKEVVVVLKKEGASIEGTVCDENGEPSAQAAVHLLDTRRSWSSVELKATVTDEEGHYVLAAVADGTYRVKASLGEQEVVSGAVPIVEGKNATGVNLALPALGHIAGRVTDEQDQPLAGVGVSSLTSRGGRGSRNVATDSDGRYRFDDLLEGEEYHVSVFEERGFTRAASHSQEVTCSADDVDFTFKATGFGTVSGFVYQESDGSPVTEFDLLVRGKETGVLQSFRRFNSEDGSFSLPDVVVGLWVIEVYVGGGRPKHRTEPFEVVAGEDVVQVIYLPETGTVRGSVVRASDGRPVTKFRLSLIDQAHSRSWRSESHFEGKRYESEEGLFQCEDVKPGRYIIGVVAEGLPDFKSEPFEVTAGAETVQEILIGEGGVIRGVVVDQSGLPVQDAVVEVVWGESRVEYTAPQPRLTPPRDTTGKAGKFELTKITPGKVRLRVTHADYASLEVRDVAVSEEAPVENLELKLERGSVVFGWVKDADGELRGDVGVSLSGQESKHTQTNYRGRYRFEHVSVGTYRLRTSYLSASLPNFEVKSGEDTEINIDFAEAGTISGTIHAPAEGNEVWFRITLEGSDKAAGVRRRVKLQGENVFKLEGVFPGKYALRLDAYWKNSEGRRGNPAVTTNPREIIVEVTPEGNVTQDITVTKIEERE